MTTKITGAAIAELCTSVHADNVAAGWWSDLKTGERIDRNVGELLMLVVTELSEAADGLNNSLMDDKLPHRQMVEVELADTAIRIFDLGGGLGLNMHGAFNAVGETDLNALHRGSHTPNDYLLRIIGFVSQAMEHHRKSRPNLAAYSLAVALHGIFILGELLELDVMGAVAEKRAFNKSRQDHSREARLADGGKKC